MDKFWIVYGITVIAGYFSFLEILHWYMYKEPENINEIIFTYKDNRLYIAKFEGLKWVVYRIEDNYKYSQRSEQTIFFNEMLEKNDNVK